MPSAELAPPPARARLGGPVAAAVAVTAWGAGNVVVKSIGLGGLALAFHRLWLGAVVYVVALHLSGRRLRWSTLRAAAPGGVAFGVNVPLFFTALKWTTVANATVIAALQPALLLLVSGPLFGETVRRRDVGWTAVALGGVTLVVFGSAATPVWSPFGDLFAVAAVVTWAAYFAASKHARRSLGAFEYQTALLVVAALVVAPVALATGGVGPPAAATWVWVAVLVAVPGSGHLLMNWAHAHTRLSVASLLTLAIPVVSTVGAAWFLAEPVVGWQLAGMAVVLGALAAVIAGPRRGRMAWARRRQAWSRRGLPRYPRQGTPTAARGRR